MRAVKKRLAAWGRRTAVATVLVAALVAALYVAGFRVVLLRWVVNSGTGFAQSHVASSSDALAECSKISCSVTTVLVVLPNHDWYGVQAWGSGLGLSHFQGLSTRAP